MICTFEARFLVRLSRPVIHSERYVGDRVRIAGSVDCQGFVTESCQCAAHRLNNRCCSPAGCSASHNKCARTYATDSVVDSSCESERALVEDALRDVAIIEQHSNGCESEECFHIACRVNVRIKDIESHSDRDPTQN